ncbi:hypothetical protein ACTXT7_007001 [Hymenolepis weldensis]
MELAFSLPPLLALRMPISCYSRPLARVRNHGPPLLNLFEKGLYVVHIFPPCDFSHAILRIAAPDLHQSIISAQLPHLLIVITTV